MTEAAYSGCNLAYCLRLTFSGAFVNLDSGLLAACLTLAAGTSRISVHIVVAGLVAQVALCQLLGPWATARSWLRHISLCDDLLIATGRGLVRYVIVYVQQLIHHLNTTAAN
jgi:hypothetical protein